MLSWAAPVIISSDIFQLILKSNFYHKPLYFFRWLSLLLSLLSFRSSILRGLTREDVMVPTKGEEEAGGEAGLDPMFI